MARLLVKVVKEHKRYDSCTTILDYVFKYIDIVVGSKSEHTEWGVRKSLRWTRL